MYVGLKVRFIVRFSIGISLDPSLNLRMHLLIKIDHRVIGARGCHTSETLPLHKRVSHTYMVDGTKAAMPDLCHARKELLWVFIGKESLDLQVLDLRNTRWQRHGCCGRFWGRCSGGRWWSETNELIERRIGTLCAPLRETGPGQGVPEESHQTELHDVCKLCQDVQREVFKTCSSVFPGRMWLSCSYQGTARRIKIFCFVLLEKTGYIWEGSIEFSPAIFNHFSE